MFRTSWLIAVGLVAASLVGCERLECGEGTVEMDGVCVIGNPVEPTCGPGTYFDGNTCVNADLVGDGGLIGLCGDNTAAQVDDAGVVHCVGTGGGSCDEEINCPVPSGPNKTTVCGRIYDIQTTGEVVGDEVAKLKVTVYDALAFAGGSMTELGSDFPDACGRFVVPDVVVPFTTFIAVGTDDKPDSQDEYRLTGIATSPVGGQTTDGMRAFATRRTTDMNWTTTAGLTGATFVDRGVYLPIYIDPTATDVLPFPGAPVAGVTIAHSGTTTDPANDYYFDDAEGNLTRFTVAASSFMTTGINGSGLWLGGDLMEFTGNGAEPHAGTPEACTWPKTLAKAVPGAVFVQERIAEGGACGGE